MEQERKKLNEEKQRSPSRQQWLYSKDIQGRQQFLESQRHKSPKERYGRRKTSSQEIGWLIEENWRIRQQREQAQSNGLPEKTAKTDDQSMSSSELMESTLISKIDRDATPVNHGRKRVCGLCDAVPFRSLLLTEYSLRLL